MQYEYSWCWVSLIYWNVSFCHTVISTFNTASCVLGGKLIYSSNFWWYPNFGCIIIKLGQINYSNNTTILWVISLILILNQCHHQTNIADWLTYIKARCCWSYQLPPTYLYPLFLSHLKSNDFFSLCHFW